MIAACRLAGRLIKRDRDIVDWAIMETTMPKTNVVAIRDKRGLYLKGCRVVPVGRSDRAIDSARIFLPTCTPLAWNLADR